MESKLEHILTHTHKPEMVFYVRSNPGAFEETLKLAVIDKQPYSWRASWALWSCMEKDDLRVKPYLDKIIRVLPKVKDNQQRDLMIILHKMELNDDQEGRLLNICIRIWEKIGKQPSVRMNAFKLIAKIAKKYPELAHEVSALLATEYLDTLSPGVRSSVLKMGEAFKSTRSGD